MDFGTLKTKAEKDINNAKDLKALENARVVYLGRKSELTQFLRTLGDMPVEERKKVGTEANRLRKELEELLAKRADALGKNYPPPSARAIDLTMPGKKVSLGHKHPLTKVEEEMRNIFSSMNFSVVEGPEVESEYYNFDALNIPAFHPAREMWDTFWLKSKDKAPSSAKAMRSKQGDRLLMRTHTSPMQIRYMEKHRPPFQIIVPGRVFRYEATDASHEINFYQLEGLMVGKEVSLANFKFVIEAFFKEFFKGKNVEIRYRPSYFPFVEPGLEVDIKLKGKWLEVMGAGMVHPHVFEAAHYNPREWQGFAFGVGVDRLAMIKYNIPDVRLFYAGDLRFITQF